MPKDCCLEKSKESDCRIDDIECPHICTEEACHEGAHMCCCNFTWLTEGTIRV